MTIRTIHFAVAEADSRDGIEQCHPHMLRHATGFYLVNACHSSRSASAISVKSPFELVEDRTKVLDRPLDPDSVYHNIVRKYGRETGIDAQVNGLCVHSLRATAATNALDNKADIAKVQEWLGHANVPTTRLYDRRKTRLEDSPTFHVRY